MLYFSWQDTTTGQDLLDVVLQHLNLLETAYFGLRFLDPENHTVSSLYTYRNFEPIGFFLTFQLNVAEKLLLTNTLRLVNKRFSLQNVVRFQDLYVQYWRLASFCFSRVGFTIFWGFCFKYSFSITISTIANQDSRNLHKTPVRNVSIFIFSGHYLCLISCQHVSLHGTKLFSLHNKQWAPLFSVWVGVSRFGRAVIFISFWSYLPKVHWSCRPHDSVANGRASLLGPSVQNSLGPTLQ